jgi:hypothetical protein
MGVTPIPMKTPAEQTLYIRDLLYLKALGIPNNLTLKYEIISRAVSGYTIASVAYQLLLRTLQIPNAFRLQKKNSTGAFYDRYKN